MPRSDTVEIRTPSASLLRVGHVTILATLGAISLNFLLATGHDAQRCIEIALLCISTPILLVRFAKGVPAILPTSAACALLAFFSIGLASAAAASSLRHAIYEWSSFLLLAFVAFGIAVELARTGGRGIGGVLQLVGLACGLHALRLLAAYAAALASGYQMNMHALAVGFSNARFLNHTQTALLPLIVLLYLQAPSATAARRAWFALAAFWWALLYVSEARATILGLGAGAVLALALRRSHARAFLKAMALSALAGVIIYVLGFILLPTLIGLQPIGTPSNVLARTAADPSSGRTLLWRLALQLIAAHPWLGVGPHHFAHEGHELYIGAHPHDWLLQIGVEWGVPALLCLLGAVGLGTRGLVRAGARIAERDLYNQQIHVGLLVSCAAIFVDGLFSGVLVMPQSQLAIMLVVGCGCGWLRSLNAGALTAAHAPGMRALGAALAIVALCGLVWSVAPDFVRHARGEPLTAAEQAINDRSYWPRLWEAGYF